MNTLDLNSLEALQVIEDLRKNNIVNYTMRPGKDCIWVTHGLVDAYYIFRDGKLVDIQID